MSDKRDDRFVDELLDAALSRYAASEPRAGLEERLLAELRTRPAPPPAWAGGWQPVAVAAVVVVLVAGVFYFTRQPAPEPVPAARAPEASVIAPAPVAVPPLPPVVAARRTPGVRPHRVPMPRREQFPSPVPLSEQELLLLRYAQQTPPEQLMTARLGEGKLAALRIEPLRISPLISEPN